MPIIASLTSHDPALPTTRILRTRPHPRHPPTFSHNSPNPPPCHPPRHPATFSHNSRNPPPCHPPRQTPNIIPRLTLPHFPLIVPTNSILSISTRTKVSGRVAYAREGGIP